MIKAKLSRRVRRRYRLKISVFTGGVAGSTVYSGKEITKCNLLNSCNFAGFESSAWRDSVVADCHKNYPAQENPPVAPFVQLPNPDPPMQLTLNCRLTSLIPHFGQAIGSFSLLIVKTSKSQSHASHLYS